MTPDPAPVPLREFVLKLAGRCNLACTYCYVYTGADQSWRWRTQRMPLDTVARVGQRIAAHAQQHGLDRVRVVLHGGEPLLYGAAGLDAAGDLLRGSLPGSVELDLTMQTNGVLLDEEILAVAHRHRIRIGVSVDGEEATHDRHRVRPDGRGSYASVRQALELLTRERHRALFAGVLTVVDPAADPVATYESLLGFGPPAIDFLLPHGHWGSPPPSGGAGASGTPYGDWLVAVFERWYGAPRQECEVRVLTGVVDSLLGGFSRTEQIGLSPVAHVVVDTDGSLQQTDALKLSYPGAPETGLDVFRHSFEDVLRSPQIAGRQAGVAGLAEQCRRCPVLAGCGGGHYAHRFRPGHGYRNPSVYCPDLYHLVQHVARRLGADLARLEQAGSA
ncbi:FxsB family cyclophane-forming radical SAM/SPASM peptide maturase [Dactylosporangium sp. NPDC049525]|uniref:FxsB family cyclophane-forming radical SAM/SPASM peptide maturase n=1 Tax=Dactylosporangium sp. NPDC049525 TaxID=3154730 RepID=UPI0034191324